MSMPQLVNKRIKILQVVKHYKLQYKNGMDRVLWDGTTPKDVLYKLEQLDLNICSEKDIEDIIGNKSWTAIYCDICGESVDKAVWMGAQLDFNSHTALVCKGCLQQALSLFS